MEGKIIFHILIGLLLSFQPLSTRHDVEFKPYIKSFEEKYSVSVLGRVEMTEIKEKNTAARCNSLRKHIVVDEDNWLSLQKNKKEILIYHELGHCYLNLRHTKERKDGSVYIMHPQVLNTMPQEATIEDIELHPSIP